MKKGRHKKEKSDHDLMISVAPISPETKKSVIAVLLFGVTLVLLLAAIGKAGPAGDFLFGALSHFFGWGYYLWPLITFLLTLSFLFSHEEKFLGMTILGVAGFIFSGLGLIDIIFPEKGGLVGNAIGAIEIPFGYIASIVLTASLLIASLLIALNARIVLTKIPKEEELEGEKERPTLKALEQKPIVIKNPDGRNEMMVLTDAKTALAAPPKTEEKRREEPSETEIDIAHGPTSRAPRQSNAIKNYSAPPLALLKTTIEKPLSGDIRANANIIKRTLESFGIHVEMGEINIGPKVTRYTLKPAEGIKLTRLVALNQDLALALAAHPIRMEAPIPGKSLVGIEVPNKTAAIVRLGTLLGFGDFENSGTLGFALGRDVTGEPIYANIEKMPHMLIAGATGSGKSIAIHTLIVSLLAKNSPELLKLVLIDPKRVELSMYDGVPHLVAPVITEGKKAVGVFRWAISEMERRYEILLKAGAKDIKGYNKANDPPMPFLVIVVDELADLMAAYGREIETSIVRLAQMARATGIHLILSTQRPSVEVITGLIKANITARVALQVASQVDSRTILDMAGAEKLLGGGDMLFISSEFSKPKRIQGAYISEEEIHKVVDHIMEHNKTYSDDTVQTAATLNAIKSEGEMAVEAPAVSGDMFDEFAAGDGDEDELYDEAVSTVVDAKKASASLLQRRLKVGYARAARLLDIMESKGVIGPGDGAKPREVFLEKIGGDITPQDFKPNE
jgi:S-DNA-T family DNA segregation ATPase FtsK/SpoIIIE